MRRREALFQNEALKNALDELPPKERLKRFPPFAGVRHAIKKTLRLSAFAFDAAKKENVPLCLIQAVIFRETLGCGVEDVALDWLFKNTSRGVCQIRPATARRADKELGYPELAIKEYRHILMNDEKNILYCARVLAGEAKAEGLTLDTLDAYQKVLLKYNGGIHYAQCAARYAMAFKQDFYFDGQISIGR